MQPPLKASGWWNYKIPPMLAVAYFALATAPRPPVFSAIRLPLLLYLIAVVGIAGFGHLYLDIFDVDEDRLLGKSNLWAPLRNGQRLSLVFLLLAMSVLPWLILPIGRIGAGLIGLEFLMFLLYATPPVRLKERGFPGIVADSMYAHGLPAMWTWIPFSRLSGSSAPAWVPVLIAGWAFIVGMRHLLQHQVIQFESDQIAHARTAVVRRGREAALSLIVSRLLPLEFATFTALAVVMGFRSILVPVGFAVYVIWEAFKMRFIWLAGFNFMGSIDDADRSTVVGTLLLTRFYERWLPVLILGGLAITERSYVVLLVVHLVVFHSGIVELFRTDIPLVKSYFRSLGARPSYRVTRAAQ